MLPTWMIEELWRERREREARQERQRAQLWIEEPACEEQRERPEPARGSVVIHIEIA